MRSPGFVYVMTNARTRGMVKIGKTAGPPEDRAQELLSNGSAEILQLRDAAYFSDSDSAENFIHDRLAMYRDNDRPEYFAVTLEVATGALSEAMARLVGTRKERPQGTAPFNQEAAQDDQSGCETFAQAENMRRQYPAAALLQFERAVRAGEARAYVALAEMYENGEGVDPDPRRAMEWLEKGARANARECRGALAERYLSQSATDPEAYANAQRCIRSYFQGLNLVSITGEHLPVVISRMRLYMKILQTRVEAEDRTLVPQILDGLTARVHHNTGPADRRTQSKMIAAWSKNWHAISGMKRKALLSPTMKIVLGVTLVCSVTFVLIPAVRQRNSNRPGDDPPPMAPVETEESTPVSAPKIKVNPLRHDKPRVAPPRPVVALLNPKRDEPAPAPAPAAVHVVPPAAFAPAPAPQEQTSAQQLATHFDVDKTKAMAAFQNETVRITDVVTKTGRHDVSFKKVKCKFDGETPATLSTGSRATVEGVVRGKGFWTGTITLDHCRILP